MFAWRCATSIAKIQLFDHMQITMAGCVFRGVNKDTGGWLGGGVAPAKTNALAIDSHCCLRYTPVLKEELAALTYKQLHL